MSWLANLADRYDLPGRRQHDALCMASRNGACSHIQVRCWAWSHLCSGLCMPNLRSIPKSLLMRAPWMCGASQGSSTSYSLAKTTIISAAIPSSRTPCTPLRHTPTTILAAACGLHWTWSTITAGERQSTACGGHPGGVREPEQFDQAQRQQGRIHPHRQ